MSDAVKESNSEAAPAAQQPSTSGKGFRYSRLKALQKRLGQRVDYLWWVLRGKPARSPHLLKQKTVLATARAYQLDALVETGTYYGEMVAAMRKRFRSISTIEADAGFYALAQSMFGKYPHIRLLYGDSAMWIPKLLKDIHTPCLFWLDGGYFIWDAKEGSNNRLMSEIDSILSHPVKQHVVLLDDARGLNGTHGTPRIEDFIGAIHAKYPERTIEVKHDIIRIYPHAH